MSWKSAKQRHDYYVANKKTILRRSHDYYHSHREERITQDRARRAMKRDVYNRQARARHAANKEQDLARCRAYYATNKRTILERQRDAYRTKYPAAKQRGPYGNGRKVESKDRRDYMKIWHTRNPQKAPQYYQEKKETKIKQTIYALANALSNHH